MFSPRSTSVTLIVGLALLSALALGCKKDQPAPASEPAKEESGKAKPGAMIATAEDPGTAGAAATPVTSTQLAMLPAKSEFVMGISVSAVRRSPLWKKYGSAFSNKLNADSDYQKFKSLCAFDPLMKVDSILVGGHTEKEWAVMLINGIPRAEFTSCVTKIAKEEGGAVKVDGNTLKISDRSEDFFLGWTDDGTLVVATDGKGQMSDATFLKARLAGKDGLDANAAFKNVIAKTDTTATVWMSMIPEDESVAAGLGGTPSGMFLSVGLQAGLAISGGASFATAEEAKEMAATASSMLPAFKGQAGPLAKFIDKVTFVQAENDLRVTVALSSEELQSLIDIFGASMGDVESMLEMQ